MEKNLTTNYWSKWLSREGIPKIVIPLKFIGKVLDNSYDKTYTYNFSKYNCEEWLCEIDGEKKILRFRVPAERTPSFSWSYSPAKKETEPLDPITCSYNRMNNDPKDISNLSLSNYKKRQKIKIDKLIKLKRQSSNKLIKKGITLRLEFLESPDGKITDNLEYGTVGKWTAFKREYPIIIKSINTLLKEY